MEKMLCNLEFIHTGGREQPTLRGHRDHSSHLEGGQKPNGFL